MLAPILTNLLKDAAFKDAMNRAFDMAKVFLDQFIVRLDSLERRMSTMEHSLEIMVNARKKLGLWSEDERSLKNIKFGPVDKQVVKACGCGSCSGDGLD